MKYDYTKIEDYCNQMNIVNIDIKKQFDIIENELKQVQSNWTGNASDYYMKQIKNFSLKLDDFYSDLNACVAFLQKCSDSYANLDKKIIGEMNDIIAQSTIFSQTL